MSPPEAESNDPFPLEMSPQEFRAAGHRLVDHIAAFLESLPERPAAVDADPTAIRALLGDGPLPAGGEPASDLLDRAAAMLFDNSRLNGHPRGWGYIIGSPAPLGALGDLLAASVNANVSAWNGYPLSTEMELQVIRWIAEFLGYPGDCGGILTSGGNMANFIGFLVARRAKAGPEIRRDGVGSGPPLTAYASEETHTWVQKAADLFGLGTGAIRWVPTDAELRMDLAVLRRLIEQDRAAGKRPFLVVGTAGTVSTGAVDPLPGIAEIAREHDLWFHVDGAYGAPAVVAADAPPALAGLRLADSLAVDAHKWFYVPLEAGCALVRDRRLQRDTFAYHPPYYHHFGHEGEETVDFHEYGPQNSRGMRALKVWLCLRRAGRTEYVRMIERNIRYAGELAVLLEQQPDFQVFTRGLSVTTFRYVPADLRTGAEAVEQYLDRLNGEIMWRVQKGGEAYISNAVLGGRYALRTCITNFRTTRQDFAALPRIVRRHGEALDATLRPALNPEP